jgi:hypothetical protein
MVRDRLELGCVNGEELLDMLNLLEEVFGDIGLGPFK